MSKLLLQACSAELEAIKQARLYKNERVITTPQRVRIMAHPLEEPQNMREVLNLCANNYLGLADDPVLIEAAKGALDSHGFGMASVRFICGTQDLHQTLETQLAEFLGTDDALLFSSCFDANAGIFEVLLTADDAIISDELNHASIIDGIRLCKARRLRYANNTMSALETCLQEAQSAKNRLIVTDGVFSMDGAIANLPGICELAERYDALVMVDDSHAVGFMGKTGAGVPEHYGVSKRVHLYSGTFGKALGGASGGYIAGARPFVDLLRQRARPYLFSNALAPAICAATLKALELVKNGDKLRARLHQNARFFREGLKKLGFNLIPGAHPIIPVMLYDAALAQEFAAQLMRENVYVTAFSFPVVPRQKARIRTQASAAHTKEDLEYALDAFEKTARQLDILKGS